MKKIGVFTIPIFFLLSCSSLDGLERANGRIQLTVNSFNWYVTIPEGGLEKQIQLNRPGDPQLDILFKKDLGGNPISISISIEPNSDCTNAKSCRDKAWARMRSRYDNVTDLVLSEIGEAAIVEFLLPQMESLKDLRAYYYKDGYLIEIRVFKVFFKQEDEAVFRDIINSVLFQPKQNN